VLEIAHRERRPREVRAQRMCRCRHCSLIDRSRTIRQQVLRRRRTVGADRLEHLDTTVRRRAIRRVGVNERAVETDSSVFSRYPQTTLFEPTVRRRRDRTGERSGLNQQTGGELATLLVTTESLPSAPIKRTVCGELANWWIPTRVRLVIRPIRTRRGPISRRRRDRSSEESGGNYQSE